jgi:hypothetical protein
MSRPTPPSSSRHVPFSALRLEDELCGLADAGDDRRAFGDPFKMLQPVAGEDVDTRGSAGPGEFDVVGMIADGKGAPQVDPMIEFRPVEKEGARLHAAAAVTALVRTDIGGDDLDAGLGQAREDMGVDALNIQNGDGPLGHTGLIGDDEQVEALSQAAKRRDRTLKELDLGRVGEVPAVLDDGPVPVQENGRARGTFFLAHGAGSEVMIIGKLSQCATILAYPCRLLEVIITWTAAKGSRTSAP